MDKKDIPLCDFCALHYEQVQAVYDGKTTMESWAYMCEDHFASHGVGLGKGLGQKIEKIQDK